MIKGLHAMFYTKDADATREFLRDKLGLKGFDVGGGWLIFNIAGEIGCHPSDKQFHGLSFYCDDINGTVAALKKKGVEFTSSVKDEGYGLVIQFKMPDGSSVQLYEPKYSTKTRPAAAKKAARKKILQRKPAAARK
jgi:catechol 2,3-dioxygenase-like lactoylglutathione lyase family enzyme